MEEKLSKANAKKLYDSGDIYQLEVGTYKGLAEIHRYHFDDLYELAGKTCTVNTSKGNFWFAPVMYLEAALAHINKMSQTSFEEIIVK